MFIITDWSNVGMDLQSVYHYNPVILPSKYQLDDDVILEFPSPINAIVLGVHFHTSATQPTVKYDLEVKWVRTISNRVKSCTYRLYNISEELLSKA